MTIVQKMSLKLAVLLALITGAWAADTSGKILGTVKDPAGNLAPQASVTLTNKATGVKQTTHADAQGEFAFPVVPVGTYELLVTMETSALINAPTLSSISAARSKWRFPSNSQVSTRALPLLKTRHRSKRRIRNSAR